MVPGPVKALLFLFPVTPALEDQRLIEDEWIKSPEGKTHISNACGTIALLHTLVNTNAAIDEESPLANFLQKSISLSPHERAQLLEKTDLFASIHESTAQMGQSDVPTDLDTNLHFIAYIEAPDPVDRSSRLLEFDGRRPGPFDRGSCTDFLQSTHMPNLTLAPVLIRASRPAGWVFGPILFGIGFLQSGYTPKRISKVLLIILQTLTFSFPLCIIVFGINDVYDYPNDANNPRKLKAGLEGGVLFPSYHLLVRNAAYLSTVFILLISLSSQIFENVFATTILLSVGWQYSAPPLRLKEVPFLDSISNGLIVFLACSGIHALGATVDYQWDMDAGQTTIATYSGPAVASFFSFLSFRESDNGHVFSISSLDLLFIPTYCLVDYNDGTPLAHERFTGFHVPISRVTSYILSSNALAAVLFLVIIAVIWSNQNQSRKPSKRRDANLKPLKGQKKNAVKENIVKQVADSDSPQIKTAQPEGSIPGGIPGTDIEQSTLSSSSASLKKEKKKKGRGSTTPIPSDTAPASSIDSIAGPSRSTHAPSRGNAAEEAWTRVESRNKALGRNIATSDAGLTTTTSMDDDASSADGLDHSVDERNRANPKTLAEKLLPKGRKTEVDDILETPNYPELSRVMRINSSPQQQQPATGFSWGDYEDANDVRGMDADGEEDGGWDVVVTKSRGKAKHSRPVQADKAVETKTKKQRQREAKKEAEKAGRDEAERQRLETLGKHQREREKALMEEQFGKKAKKASGGMTAVVDARGNLGMMIIKDAWCFIPLSGYQRIIQAARSKTFKHTLYTWCYAFVFYLLSSNLLSGLMSPQESFVDVLIIGAGPAGLIPKKVPAGQADGIQPRTIEVLQSYGLADRLLQEGNHMYLAAFYNPSANGGIERTDRTSDVAAPMARYPFEVTLHQGAIEAIFLDSMKNYGIQVDRPIMPISLEISDDRDKLGNPNAYCVKAVLKHLDTTEHTEIVHAKYAIGADGAHSWVRKTLGIDMEGEQTDYIWGVVDTVPDTDFPDIRNKSVIHSNNGSCMVIPREGDKVRLYIQLNEADAITNGRVDKNKMTAEKLLEVAKKSFQPYTLEFPDEIDWWTIYIIGQRVASAYHRHLRVFIAGDACHTHSPKAGQGMNASMNDTHNLSWKIAQVLRGWADASILETYELERRKFAQDLIEFDRKFAALFSGKPRTEEFQDGVSHEEFMNAFRTAGGLTSGVGIHYAQSPITNDKYQSYASKLIIGERTIPQLLIRAADGRPYEIQDLLPADARFKILVFTGDTGDKTQIKTLNILASELEKLLTKYTRGENTGTIFDILSISTASKESVDYTVLPKVMRSHWSKVFVDQKEVHGSHGGTCYAVYGIESRGAVVVVRPDGYVGTIAPLDKPEHLDEYFNGFVKH
ncbi:hypothetical protein Clacol_005612 [Clathrus columnatus]|uniref:ubiquitinyl hydrolase 1 n=1 Tax=Clathrus columnatus TaxID=1419009 RepID=A0AAV5AHG8_9AGAM|nr:hypothetical protein Clacol_005612 [Clathrus columnatus]